MAGKVIVGTQWGDEGKGKITDFYAGKANLVVRFQGGNNAGHTVVVGNKNYKLHLLPSGVVAKKRSLLASGVVINPKVLLEEIKLTEKLLGKVNLGIDHRAHIIMPYHIVVDCETEKVRGKKKIGTTGMGIGPCYADQATRLGIRFEDLIDKKAFEARLKEVYPLKKKIIEKAYNAKISPMEKILSEYLEYGKKLKKYNADVSVEVDNALKKNKKVFFEGAQGTFLDKSFGTYPFVTSSHPVAGFVGPGVGIGCAEIKSVVGVVKAYTTRVGEGPFLTELHGPMAKHLRAIGNEFGTTTGRARRIGWFDLPMIKTAKRLNSLTEIALTKLDILSGLGGLQMCVAYKCRGKTLKEAPTSIRELEKCRPIYKKFKGFELDGKYRSRKSLPKNAKDYISFIERQTGIPIKIISLGPKRNETLHQN